MGIVHSNTSDYYHTHYLMSADQEIDFRFEQIDYIEQAKSWGRAEALSQGQQTGLIGGMGGAGPNMYGIGYGFWKGINNAIQGLGLLMVPMGLIGIILGFFMRFSPMLMFAFSWMFVTFMGHKLFFASRQGYMQAQYSLVPMASIVGGLIVAAIFSFAIYAPFLYNNELGKTEQLALGIGGGIMLVLILLYFWAGFARRPPMTAGMSGHGIQQMSGARATL